MEYTSMADGVTPVLNWWLSEVQRCLGQTLCSVVLHGSTVLGDFCPRWSDVDVCVVVNPPVTQPQARDLGAIHDRMRELFIEMGRESWESSQAVEGSYIPMELVTDETREMPCFTAGGSTRRWSVSHPISPFDRYMLAHFGREIAGAGVAFAPPSARALITQTEYDLAALRNWADSRRTSMWLAGMLHWAARSLVFWRDGRMLSRTAALRHEIERGSEFADAFELALRVRTEGRLAAAQYHEELEGHFERSAAACADEIEHALQKH